MKEFIVLIAILVIIGVYMNCFNNIMDIVDTLSVSEDIKNNIQKYLSKTHTVILVCSVIICAVVFFGRLLS